ncbi:hypothetical protein [Vibrio jasicida]|uniref:hypothetical protein n=1 Tax=Vibrio jasicida TaxID=766224 RepID=UPI000CE54861|nr:hypothetical protein [Vibrio jasicida]
MTEAMHRLLVAICEEADKVSDGYEWMKELEFIPTFTRMDKVNEVYYVPVLVGGKFIRLRHILTVLRNDSNKIFRNEEQQNYRNIKPKDLFGSSNWMAVEHSEQKLVEAVERLYK